uniref:Uncharacterized protein n=1 Tax=Trichobilharzia regenti TaxID=157069 RepID=A0AA85J9G6_TRIRE
SLTSACGKRKPVPIAVPLLHCFNNSLIFSVFIRIPTRGFDFIDNMKSTILVAVIVCASIAGVYSDYPSKRIILDRI